MDRPLEVLAGRRAGGEAEGLWVKMEGSLSEGEEAGRDVEEGLLPSLEAYSEEELVQDSFVVGENLEDGI